MRTPNIDAIKGISAFDVAQTLNLIHQQVKTLTPDRWAFHGSSNATYLEFFKDGSYRDHKRDVGGSCIDLVMQTLCAGHEHDQRYFMEAAKMIAAAFNLWRDTEDVRKKAREIATRQNSYSNVHNYLRAALKNTLAPPENHQPEWTDTIQQIDRFMGALELSRHQVTWAAITQKTQSLGFAPAVPWQGKHHHEKENERGQLHPFGGWTYDLAQAFSHHPMSLRLFCVDIDGDGERWPQLKLILRLVHQLKQREIVPRALIISSWNKVNDDERVKVHLYFVAKERAKNPEQFKHWHEHLEAIIGGLVNRWNDVEDSELATLKRDHATHSISRIMRVPGVSKYGHEYAASIYSINDEAIVDFPNVIQTANVVVSYANRRYHFGERCEAVVVKEVDGQLSEKKFSFAHDIWPLKNYRRVETGETGVVFRYHTRFGQVLYGTMAADAFTNKNVGKKAVSEAALKGARIRPESENTLATALGFWAHVGIGPSVNMVSTPGWHTHHNGAKVYVNGVDVHGADDWEVDRDADEIQRRSSRAGTLAEWKTGADRLLSTYGLGLALGQSLAGPLIELLDLTPFTIHLCGHSTHGKSTAARLAGSIWGHPRHTFQSWDVTNVGIEIAAETANGACLVLDELKRFGDDQDRLSRVVYGLNSLQGRLKANQKSELAKQRSWRLTTISTGEYSLYQFLGEKFQGGHGVRFLDIPTRSGDLTRDKQHAKALDRLSYEQHGVAGNEWIRFLSDPHVQREIITTHRDWLDTVGDWSDSPELMRICDNLAVIGTALSMASESGLIGWESDGIRDILRWCLDLMTPNRADGRTPDERALAMLKRWFLIRPDRFPKSNDASRSRHVLGYSERDEYANGHEENECGPTRVYTTYSMIHGSDLPRLTGVQATPWLDWCIANGHAETDHWRTLRGNQRQRWIVFTMGEEPPADWQDEKPQALAHS